VASGKPELRGRWAQLLEKQLALLGMTAGRSG